MKIEKGGYIFFLSNTLSVLQIPEQWDVGVIAAIADRVL